MIAGFDEALAETRAYLGSAAALASVALDPYWPKWDAPWWRLVLLAEVGHVADAPAPVVNAIAAALTTHYLPAFPFTLEEIPPGKDPTRHIACHCQLGTIDRVLHSRGVEVDRVLPWLRSWYLRYQLADGGWNCDEAAYTRPIPRSSVVSTVPVLEALLARPALTPEEEAALDRGAAYLIERRLVRSLSKNAVARPEWLVPAFPRFYEYDALRGLSVVVAWAERRGSRLPAAAVAEVAAVLDERGATPGRRVTDGPRTIRREPDGTWSRGHAPATFPLLDLVSAPGVRSPWLERERVAARAGLERLATRGLLVR